MLSDTSLYSATKKVIALDQTLFIRPSKFPFHRYEGTLLWLSSKSGYGELRITQSPVAYTGDPWARVGDVMPTLQEFIALDFNKVTFPQIKTLPFMFDLVCHQKTGKFFAYDVTPKNQYTLRIKTFPTSLVTVDDVSKLTTSLDKEEVEAFRHAFSQDCWD